MMALARRIPADARILVGALIALIVFTAIGVIFGPAPPAPSLSVRSDDPDGAMALRRWLEQAGYDVVEALETPADLEQMDVLFILDPVIYYQQDDGERLQRWVEEGNTLIITGDPYNVNPLLSAFEVSLSYLLVYETLFSPAAPTLTSPPFADLRGHAYYGVETERPGVVVHFSTETMPVLVSFAEGQGTVWVSGAMRPFSNRGLQDAGSPSLIQNMLAIVPSTATIGFDEYGHAYGKAVPTVSGWLFGTAPGWGILSALIVTMTFLAFRGRRFGSAVPIPEERLRREPVEYIQAMANLFRRSGQRTEMLKHYKHQLRRRLSERYALDPGLSDADLVKTIVFYDPGVDESSLRTLLKRLSQTSVSESELVSVAIEVDQFLRSFE
jgi:hypothetical protein